MIRDAIDREVEAVDSGEYPSPPVPLLFVFSFCLPLFPSADRRPFPAALPPFRVPAG